MDARTAKEAVRFVRDIAAETAAKELSIVFHGGEPLLAPFAVWETMLDEICVRLSDYRLSMNIQSNLWNLDDDFLELFRAHGVSIGASLDGPKELCDLTRGEGYFDRTFASIRRANVAGRTVSAIATITPQTLPYTREIAKYFRNNGIPMILHGAIAGMDRRDSPYALNAAEYASMIKDLLPWYVENRKYIRIDTLDHFVKGAVCGQPGVCTFRDCFGMFLAIAPDGEITSCQRLAGRREFSLGNISDRPTLAALYESPAAKEQRERERRISERCGGCNIYPVCKGGCYYNARASDDGDLDPLCEAYKEIHSFIQDRLMEEMQTPENREAIMRRNPAGSDEHPLLRRGAYISLSGKVHPSVVAGNARSILSLYELSKTNDPHAAAQNLYEQKICGSPGQTEKLLAAMQADLCQPHSTKNNCYFHVTFDCNLRCSHCYAEGGECKDEMDVRRFAALMSETIAAKFRQAIITGGEPLVHSQRDRLLAACREHRGKGSTLVLRTNLTGKFTGGDFVALAEAFDQIAVSVDGSEETHDSRRGKGTYQNMCGNLREYARVSATVPRAAELSLACAMDASDINGAAGQSVRALAESLQVKRTRFRPLLPLGRASRLDKPVICEGLLQHVSPDEMLQSEFRPLTTCGIGQNLFVCPDGGVYPCYAWRGEHTRIGNVFDSGLNVILSSPQFTKLSSCTVDTIAKCRDCAYRYLCGSACRAWGNQTALDLNAAPVQCDHLKQRAQSLIDAAREYLETVSK
jgi:uncharacterized protein